MSAVTLENFMQLQDSYGKEGGRDQFDRERRHYLAELDQIAKNVGLERWTNPPSAFSKEINYVPKARNRIVEIAEFPDIKVRIAAFQLLQHLLEKDSLTKETAVDLAALLKKLTEFVQKGEEYTLDEQKALIECYASAIETLLFHIQEKHILGLSFLTKEEADKAILLLKKLNQMEDIELRLDISRAREGLKRIPDQKPSEWLANVVSIAKIALSVAAKDPKGVFEESLELIKRAKTKIEGRKQKWYQRVWSIRVLTRVILFSSENTQQGLEQLNELVVDSEYNWRIVVSAARAVEFIIREKNCPSTSKYLLGDNSRRRDYFSALLQNKDRKDGQVEKAVVLIVNRLSTREFDSSAEIAFQNALISIFSALESGPQKENMEKQIRNRLETHANNFEERIQAQGAEIESMRREIARLTNGLSQAIAPLDLKQKEEEIESRFKGRISYFEQELIRKEEEIKNLRPSVTRTKELLLVESTKNSRQLTCQEREVTELEEQSKEGNNDSQATSNEEVAVELRKELAFLQGKLKEQNREISEEFERLKGESAFLRLQLLKRAGSQPTLDAQQKEIDEKNKEIHDLNLKLAEIREELKEERKTTEALTRAVEILRAKNKTQETAPPTPLKKSIFEYFKSRASQEKNETSEDRDSQVEEGSLSRASLRESTHKTENVSFTEEQRLPPGQVVENRKDLSSKKFLLGKSRTCIDIEQREQNMFKRSPSRLRTSSETEERVWGSNPNIAGSSSRNSPLIDRRERASSDAKTRGKSREAEKALSPGIKNISTSDPTLDNTTAFDLEENVVEVKHNLVAQGERSKKKTSQKLFY